MEPNEFSEAVEGVLAQARERLGARDYGRALALCRAALTLDPACAPGFSDLLTAGLGPGDPLDPAPLAEPAVAPLVRSIRDGFTWALEAVDATAAGWLDAAGGRAVHPSAFELLGLVRALTDDPERARMWFGRHALAQPWALNGQPAPGHAQGLLCAYIDAVYTDPDLPEPARSRLLARLTLERGDIVQARRRLEGLAARHPSVAVQGALAALDNEAGDFESAQTRLKTVLDLAPGDPEALRRLDQSRRFAALAAPTPAPRGPRAAPLSVMICQTDRDSVMGWKFLDTLASADRGDLVQARIFSRADKGFGWIAPVFCRNTKTLAPRERRPVGGRFVFEHVPRLMMKRVRQGRGTLVVDYGHESMLGYRTGGEEHFLEFLHFLDAEEIPRERVILLDGNPRSPAIAAAMAAETGRPSPPFISDRYLWMQLSGVFRRARRRAGGIEAQVLKASETVAGGALREKRFLSFNGMPRLHRWALVASLLERGVLDEGLVSFNVRAARPSIDPADIAMTLAAQPDETDAVRIPVLAARLDALSILERPEAAVRALAARGPMRVDVDHAAAGAVRWALAFTAADEGPYLSSYFSIITDTAFTDGASRFVSEKVMKAVAHLHPFVFLGEPGTLADMRGRGYRTFSPWIDERYDDIADPRDRLAAALAEAGRLAAMPLKDLHALYCECWPILLHNYQTFMECAPRMAEDLIAAISAAVALP